MRRAIPLTLALLLGACSQAPAAPSATDTALGPVGDAAHPVVVELFQSQGCSSCPPAIRNVNAIADRPDVLALMFAVTYWDQLGWKDTFDDPAYTARQWDYARAAHRGNVFTPQVMVNGTRSIVGANAGELAHAIETAPRTTHGPAIARSGGTVTIAAGHAPAPTTVWLVRYDPGARVVPIRAGENDGVTITHRDVVTGLSALGNWSGPAARFALPTLALGPRSAAAILVQQGRGGPIVAARRI